MPEQQMPPVSKGQTHWKQSRGYIKSSGPVCGIDDKVSGYTFVEDEVHKGKVTCEHCLFWLWDQDQPARKMDITNAPPKAEVYNIFGGTDVRDQIQETVEGLFHDTSFVENLKSIIKDADAEIDAAYNASGEKLENDEAFDADMAEIVRRETINAFRTPGLRTSLKQIVKHAFAEEMDDTEPAQRAWFEEQLNRVLDEREQRQADEQRAYQLVLQQKLDAMLASWWQPITKTAKPVDPIIQLPDRTMHYRKPYLIKAVCDGADPVDDVTTLKAQVNCPACKELMNN